MPGIALRCSHCLSRHWCHFDGFLICISHTYSTPWYSQTCYNPVCFMFSKSTCVMCDVSLDQTLSQSMNKYRAIIKVQENQTSPIFKVEMFLALLLVHLGLVLADTDPLDFSSLCSNPAPGGKCPAGWNNIQVSVLHSHWSNQARLSLVQSFSESCWFFMA